MAFPLVFVGDIYTFALKKYRPVGIFSAINGIWNEKHRGTSLFEIPLSVWVPLC